MKKNKCIIIILLFILLTINSVYAFKLGLSISSDKNKVKKNEEITIEVKWNQGMQAADYSLNYDSEKLEYLRSDIDDIFIDNSKKGIIKTSWFSIDDTDKTSIKYTFKVIKSGKLKFTTNIEGGFATGEMQIPDEYENAELIIGKSNILIVLLVIIVIVLIIITLFVFNKKEK